MTVPPGRQRLRTEGARSQLTLDRMTLTYLWTGFFLVGFAAALVQWLAFGDATVFKRIVDGTFDSAKVGVMDIALPLAGVTRPSRQD